MKGFIHTFLRVMSLGLILVISGQVQAKVNDFNEIIKESSERQKSLGTMVHKQLHTVREANGVNIDNRKPFVVADKTNPVVNAHTPAKYLKFAKEKRRFVPKKGQHEHDRVAGEFIEHDILGE